PATWLRALQAQDHLSATQVTVVSSIGDGLSLSGRTERTAGRRERAAPTTPGNTENHAQSLLRPPDPELPLRVPFPALGVRRIRAAHAADRGAAPAGGVHHADPKAEEAEDRVRA